MFSFGKTANTAIDTRARHDSLRRKTTFSRLYLLAQSTAKPLRMDSAAALRPLGTSRPTTVHTRQNGDVFPLPQV